MKISVAMSTFQGERFLRDQLESVRGQTRPPDEVVVCDDGSDDGTPAILDAFSATAVFPVHVIRNAKRLGVAGNFEKAISACVGDVIALSDQDDVWRKDKLAAMEGVFARDRTITCVFTNARQIDEYGSVQSKTLWDHIAFTPAERRLVAAGQAFDVLTVHNVATGATMALRAGALARVLPIPRIEGMLHDQWIALVLSASTRVVALDEPLIDYRKHEQQQVGAGPAVGGVGQWIEVSRKTGRSQFALWAEQVELVMERLVSLPDVPAHRIDALRDRHLHLRIRAALPQSRMRRVPIVAKEFLSGRYHRFSNHFWSAAKDIFWRLDR
ncbi:MAG TPA: glycosyltransferase family 2 protein [Thermoanaerobaculia bacterium]|nr:glycosyltransferase family 2 protein [Thermoanaerobaculia bacterium]